MFPCLSKVFYDRIDDREEIEEQRQDVLSEIKERFLTVQTPNNNELMHWFQTPDLSIRQDDENKMYYNAWYETCDFLTQFLEIMFSNVAMRVHAFLRRTIDS